MAISDAEFAAANRAGNERREERPFACSAAFDADRRRIVIALSTRAEFSFPADLAEGLRNASPEDLADIVISPSGFGISFPKLGADFDLPALMENYGFQKKELRSIKAEIISSVDEIYAEWRRIHGD